MPPRTKNRIMSQFVRNILSAIYLIFPVQCDGDVCASGPSIYVATIGSDVFVRDKFMILALYCITTDERHVNPANIANI